MSLRIEDVDLFSPSTQEDWYPAYSAIHEQAPVYKVPGSEMFLISKFEDIAWIVRNPEKFPNNTTGSSGLLQSPEAQAYYLEHGYARRQPLGTNPPLHRRYREQVDPFFSPNGAEKQRAMITATINELVDGWIERGEIEFMREFAIPLPVTVITKMLGFPVEDMPQLRTWSNAWVMPFAMNLTPAEQMYVAEQGVAFQKYIEGHIEAHREEPGHDVISHLASALFAGERPFSNDEIVNIIDHLYIGGNETTTFALTSGLWLLGRTPGLWEELKADRSKVRFFVEEVLRLESPTQGLFRRTTEDMTLHGVFVPKDSLLHLRFAAANRDADEFPEPATLDLARPNVGKHLAFSQGEHMCPGAGLSRLEQNIAWTVLLDRVEQFGFSPEKNDFTHLPGFVLRGLNQLHVTFERAK